MRYKISENCIACGACEMNCPVGAISMGDGKWKLTQKNVLDVELVHLYAQLEHQTQKNNSKLYDDRVNLCLYYCYLIFERHLLSFFFYFIFLVLSMTNSNKENMTKLLCLSQLGWYNITRGD